MTLAFTRYEADLSCGHWAVRTRPIHVGQTLYCEECATRNPIGNTQPDDSDYATATRVTAIPIYYQEKTL